jgi:hypothetical protein
MVSATLTGSTVQAALDSAAGGTVQETPCLEDLFHLQLELGQHNALHRLLFQGDWYACFTLGLLWPEATARVWCTTPVLHMLSAVSVSVLCSGETGGSPAPLLSVHNSRPCLRQVASAAAASARFCRPAAGLAATGCNCKLLARFDFSHMPVVGMLTHHVEAGTRSL